MAIKIEIFTNANKIAKDLDRIARRQMPFATALALTRLAQDGQEATQAQLNKVFELRNPKRLKKGVRIKPARKQDFQRGTIHSEVFDIDPFMALQETGGTKKATSGMLAIPDRFIHTTKRGTTGSIRKRWKPKTLIEKVRNQPGRPRKWGRHRKPRPFIMHYGSKGGSIAVRRGQNRFPLLYLYHFSPSARVSARFEFVRTVEKKVSKEFGRQFALAMRRALI